MKKIRKNLLILILIFTFAALLKPYSTYAVDNYSSFGDDSYDYDFSDDSYDYDFDDSYDYDFDDSYDTDYSSYDYVITNYDVNINVNENNTFDITEKIQVYFTIPKHGIYRTIPILNNIKRQDGSSVKARCKVTNIDVDNKFSVSHEGGNYKIKIGDKDKLLTGSQSYTIRYHYNMGKDTLKNADEFYFNIIGTEWDTAIKNVSFTINMPKPFDESKLGFTVGKKGSTSSNNIYYFVNDQIITGSYYKGLNPNNGLTIRLTLDDGYFVGAKSIDSPYVIFMFIIPILFAVISVILWFVFGRSKKPIKTVEFYPPDGFNSLEIGYMYKGYVSNKDIVSLLIYLANKGYLKITETAKSGMITKKNDFYITKLKEYDGNNENEKKFIDGLFSHASILESDETNTAECIVTPRDLRNKFYKTMNSIRSNVSSRENKYKLFEKSSLNKIWILWIMVILSFVTISLIPACDFEAFEMIPFLLIFPGLGLTALLLSFLLRNVMLPLRIFLFIWGAPFGLIPWFFLVLPLLSIDNTYLAGYLIGLACCILIAICIRNMKKRTTYGREMLGKILGFKSFLKVAEKDKLEALVIENPTYFYDILPYTYALDVSDKWIKKFEAIAIQPPDWYDGYHSFNPTSFGSFMTSAMSSAQSSMSSSPSSSGSGGGCSGGGGGGGGGGSW